MRQLILFIFCVLCIYGCKSILPNGNVDYTVGFYHQYDKFDFNKIVNPNDTSWHKQIDPLADLILKHPNWIIKIKTFLADSSSVDFFGGRLDVVTASKISTYLYEKGIDSQRLYPLAYNNKDDGNRVIYSGPKGKPFKRKKFKRNTFEWEIVAIR